MTRACWHAVLTSTAAFKVVQSHRCQTTGIHATVQDGAANGAETPGKQLPADYLIDTLLAVDPATAGALVPL